MVVHGGTCVRRTGRSVALALLAGVLWVPGTADAQGADREDPIEEIIVTAERRESTLQETPIAITAFDAEAMELRGISGVSELHLHVPNFFYTEGGGGSPITQIAIRGVGNENVTAGGDPGVAYHLDGAYLGRPATAAVDFFDVERVEVLRGPQGTLYGRNATGGSINVITRKPTDEFEALFDAGYGNYDWYRIRGAVGGPIVPGTLSARLSFVTEDRDGYLENEAPGSACANGCDDLDEQDVSAFRAQLLFTPGEHTEVLFQAQYLWDEGAVGQKRLDPFPPPIPVGGGFFFDPYAGAIPNSTDRRIVRAEADESLDLWSRQFNLKITHLIEGVPGLGDVRFTSLTSRQEMEWKQTVDNDFSELPLTFTSWETPSDQWLQEFQLASAGDGALQWLAGLFWFQEEVEMDFLFQDFGVFRFENGGTIETTSIAAFAEVSYDFEEATGMPLTLRGGLRWTRDEKEGDDFLSLTLGPAGTPIAPADSFEIDDEWKRLTGRVVGEYRIDDDVMVYASASRGYKSGGLLIGNRVIETGPGGSVLVRPNVYDPEEIWAYEVGLKGLFLEGRLQANVAAFYNDYDDLQVFLLTGMGAVIENAAEAEVKGVELELVAAPMDGLLANVTLAYLDGEYDDYVTADPTDPSGILRDLSGNRVNRSPEWTASGGIQYAIPLGDWGTLTPRLDVYWQDESFFRPQNLARDREGDWHRSDFNLTWEGPESDGGQWSLQLFVRNIEDDDNVMNISTGAGSIGFPVQAILHPPRTFGAIVGFRY